MIHRDFCNPNFTKEYSPLRMQFHFLISRYVCVDGLIPLTRKEIALELSCNIQSVDKFIKKGIKENILKMVGERLYLLKRVDEYAKGYIKHFAFLESAEFKVLNRHTQRFILYTLWAGVHQGRPLKREISTLYHSTVERSGILNIYDKASVYPILEEAKHFLELEITTQKGREMVRVKGLNLPKDKLETLNNEGELKWLDDILFEECCDDILFPAARIEILKLKKHYWTSFQELGLELFQHGLKKLLSSHKLFDLLQQGERQLGAYFHTVLTDMEQKLLSTLTRRLEYTRNAINAVNHLWASFRLNIRELLDRRKEYLERTIQIIQSKSGVNGTSTSFSFYNWLEPEKM